MKSIPFVFGDTPSNRLLVGFAIVALVGGAVVLGLASGGNSGSEYPGGRDVQSRSASSTGQREAPRHRSILSRSVSRRVGSEAPRGGPHWVSTHQLVKEHEALPCTGPNEPANFEIYSAGPSVAGLPLAEADRTCESRVPAAERPANYMTYLYGHCEIVAGSTGCAPPLQVQTWPACQRSLADYTFEGEPEPYTKLPSRGGAEVYEIDFVSGPRIEVYTESSTVVVFAADRHLALEAVDQLIPGDEDRPPMTTAEQMRGVQKQPKQPLQMPVNGAIEGKLPC